MDAGGFPLGITTWGFTLKCKGGRGQNLLCLLMVLFQIFIFYTLLRLKEALQERLGRTTLCCFQLCNGRKARRVFKGLNFIPVYSFKKISSSLSRIKTVFF